MHRTEANKDTHSAPKAGEDVFVFDVSQEAAAGRARRLKIKVPEDAKDGVAFQLQALSKHAQTAGWTLPDGEGA